MSWIPDSRQLKSANQINLMCTAGLTGAHSMCKRSFRLAFLSRINDKCRQTMISRSCVLILTIALAVLPPCRAQTSPPHAPAKADYSQEAAVLEEMSTKIAFDNDGNFTRDQISRVRVQTEDRKSTRLNSSHEWISYAVFCLK